MKSASALLFASAVAAAEYGASSTHTSSSSKIGYTTVYPGHGYEPVTVTAQYQTIPTYVADAHNSKTGSWSAYEYVSTVIEDYDGTKYTVTKTDQPVTVYHTKTTYTHTSIEKPTGYFPSAYVQKNATSTKTWYELYEKVHEVPYKNLGPHALPGYPGSGLYKDEKKQPVEVKEYKGGKWSTYTYTFTYGVPKPSVITYVKPGTYTVPAKDITIDYPTTVPYEATYTAPANKPVTYGGVITSVAKPTTLAIPYGTYETKSEKTKTVIHFTTITFPHAGTYTVVKPTTTSYGHDTTIIYPTTTAYEPGVYHHSKETVTITKSNEPYTCSYHQTSTYPTPSSFPTPSKEAYPTEYPTPSGTTPYGPDPSSDYEEPVESYGKPSAGYVKRGGVIERRKAEPEAKKAAVKRVILV